MIGVTPLCEEAAAAEVTATKVMAAPMTATNDGDAKVSHFKATRVTAAMVLAAVWLMMLEGLFVGSFAG